MTDAVQLRFNCTNTVSVEENLTRAIVTFFLNQGSFDDRLIESEKGWDGKPPNLPTYLLSKFGESVQREFDQWLETTPMAKYIADCALCGRFKVGSFHNANPGGILIPFLVDRFKVLTNYSRKRMPKNLQKSFYTRAANKLRKFAEEWHKEQFLQSKSIEEHLKDACGGGYVYRNKYTKNLVDINALYRKFSGVEDLSGVVKELMKLAGIADVMSQ